MKKKNDSALHMFGWLFYLIAIIVVVIGLIPVVKGEFNVSILWGLGGAAFAGSWGALLMGMEKIVNK